MTRFKLVAFVSLALATPAHAYVDPGSGALLLQIMAAGLFGGLITARRGIARVAQWLLAKAGIARPPHDKAPRTDRTDG